MNKLHLLTFLKHLKLKVNICALFFYFEDFNFLPQTYVLPQDLNQLKKVWDEATTRNKWIIKPVRESIILVAKYFANFRGFQVSTVSMCINEINGSFLSLLNVYFFQPASARGIGIKVIHKWSQIPKKKTVIVQR